MYSSRFRELRCVLLYSCETVSQAHSTFAIVGAPLSGMLSDRIVVAARKKRGGVWIPEDRLQAALLGAGVFAPCSILFAGIFLHLMHNTAGLILVCICFFFNGLGVSAYLLLLMPRIDTCHRSILL